MSEEEEILRTIRSIKRSAAETESTSESAARLIFSQGEEITGIAKDADTVEHNLNLSGRMISGFNSFTSRLSSIFSSEPVRKEVVTHSARPSASTPSAVVTPAPLRIAGAEGDAALDEVSAMLSSIKNKTLELSSNLQQQNATLNRVTVQVDSSRDKLSFQNSQIKK